MNKLTADQVAELRKKVEWDLDDLGGLAYARVTCEEALALLAAHDENVRLREAIDNEPEFPSDMPDEVWEVIRNDRDMATESLRLAVRMTKRNIFAAALRPDAKGGG